MALGSIRHHCILRHSARRVWDLVGDPSRVHEWLPGIAACEVEGSSRKVTLGNGLVLPEEILVLDHVQRRFQYRIDAGFFTYHRSTLDVIALGEESCVAVYSVDADPRAMALVVAGAAAAGLESLNEVLALPGSLPPQNSVKEAR
jgi:ribosome-associated toxin RatA of RatAB toxin-antitoxin module